MKIFQIGQDYNCLGHWKCGRWKDVFNLLISWSQIFETHCKNTFQWLGKCIPRRFLNLIASLQCNIWFLTFYTELWKWHLRFLQNSNLTLSSWIVMLLKFHRSYDFDVNACSSWDVIECGTCLICGTRCSQKLVIVAKFNCSKRYYKQKNAKFNHSIPPIFIFWWA